MDDIIISCENELTKISVEIAKAELLLAAEKKEEIPDWLKKCDFAGKKLTVTSRVNALFVHLSYLWRNEEYARAIAFSDMLIDNLEKYHYTSSYSMMYLYIIMALCYHKLFMDIKSIKYIKKVIEIAKPDELYLIFADYADYLDGVSDELLKEKEPEIYEKVAEIKKDFTDNYISILSILNESDLSASLTEREKEIALLVSEGLSNAEIAKKLYISKSTVNYHIRNIFSKLGVNKRSMLIKHLYFNKIK